MKQIYLNYASTSPCKSPVVIEGLVGYLQDNSHLNAGRNFDGLDDTAIALRARRGLAELFGAGGPTQILFTSGVTASLNMILHGILGQGDHVLASNLEHNAVARPLALLERQGVIQVTWLPCAPDGTMDPETVSAHMRNNTKLLVMTHASNVLGTILPVDECFAAAKQYGLFTLLDAAQTAGGMSVELGPNTDAIAFTGHKSLRGLAGVGGFAVTPGAAKAIRPVITGGTGSASHQLEQPEFLPDKFESGTPNTLGILSLDLSVRELMETGIEGIREQEAVMTRRFMDGVRTLPLMLHGTGDPARSMPVVSVSTPRRDAGELARELYDRFGIVTRSGLHCSPLAHKAAGTYPAGTLRFSFGRETTAEEIDLALDALERCLV